MKRGEYLILSDDGETPTPVATAGEWARGNKQHRLPNSHLVRAAIDYVGKSRIATYFSGVAGVIWVTFVETGEGYSSINTDGTRSRAIQTHKTVVDRVVAVTQYEIARDESEGVYDA